MIEGRSFHGSPKTGAPNERRVTALVVVLLLAVVGVAIAKPWGEPVEPAPSPGPPQAGVASPTAPSQPPTALEGQSAAPSAGINPLPTAFTTPLPPASATWTGLNWRRLATDDPLSLVTSVLRWSGGFIATGWVAGPPTSTPVWTSTDGTHWDPLIFGTSTTFWPGLAVIGLVELQTGLVAVTETLSYCSDPCSLRYIPPVVSWTSDDGRAWTPSPLLPPEWLSNPSADAPLIAVGPAGLVVASTGTSARLATSTDGSHWELSPRGGFPADFALNDVRGTATGYVAVGEWTTTTGGPEAAALWSGDGRQWPATPTLLPTSAATGSDVGSAADALVVGRNGMVAVGRGATSPGAALWWQSADGRHWAALPTFDPLGPTTCTGEGCGGQPNGALVGDGQRMVALRGGADTEVWTSTDGRGWRAVPSTGDLPGEQATQAVLLPGGVLLSDGLTTWFGQALGRSVGSTP